MALTDEEMEPEQPEELRPEDSDAMPSEDFPKVALDTDLVNSDHEVQRVLDDEDIPSPDPPPLTRDGDGEVP